MYLRLKMNEDRKEIPTLGMRKVGGFRRFHVLSNLR